MLIPRGAQIDRFFAGIPVGGMSVLGDPVRDARPVLCEIRDGAEVRPLRIFCWNVTHGGATRSSDEFRVQTRRPGTVPFFVPERATLLLGYDAERDVFAAWNANLHPNPSASASLQVPLSTLERAVEEGIAAKSRPLTAGSVEVVVAFRPMYAADYVRMLPLLDATAPAEGDATVAAMEGLPHDLDELPGDIERRRKIVQVSVAVRDGRFRTRVVEAYAGRCSFCGIGAGLVHAAHIVPVGEGGLDLVTNGVTACPTHHLAFDRGMIVASSDLQVVVNRQIILDAGGSEDDCDLLGEGLLAHLRTPTGLTLQPDRNALATHRRRWTG